MFFSPPLSFFLPCSFLLSFFSTQQHKSKKQNVITVNQKRTEPKKAKRDIFSFFIFRLVFVCKVFFFFLLLLKGGGGW
jgi:hypothetical protein